MRRGTDEQLTAATPMGRDLLARDWSDTELGPVDQWPGSLRTLVSMMLACPQPMFLAWGPNLRCFYNDAYRPILPDPDRETLGQPFRTVWGHIWDDIGPLVDRALTGEAVSVRDMQLDLRRGGTSEESWWTFSYSPAFDETGAIVGMICVTNETTAQVLSERERAQAAERLDQALSAGANIGSWDWDIRNDRVTADARFALLYGVDPDVALAGAELQTFFGGIHPDDRDGLSAAIGRAMDPSGDGSLLEEYRLLGSDGSIRWVSAQGRCTFDEAGRPIRLPGISFDITQRRFAEQRLVAAKEEREFVLALGLRQREATDPDAIMRFSAQALGERLGVNRSGFFRVQRGTIVQFAGGWTDGSLVLPVGETSFHFLGKGLVTMQQGRPITVADVRHDNHLGVTVQADASVRSGLGVPIMRHARWEAGLYLNQTEVRAWTAEEVALAVEVAELTWLAVERAEALLRLHDQVGRQRSELVQVTGERDTAAEGRKAAEGQVRQLQKMEAVGQLTGGIAHDFNNMLAVVIGGLDMIRRKLARGDTEVGRYLDAASDGADRAASLTKRLLAFSRQSPLAPEPIEPNRLVASLMDLLTRTLGERVRVETVLGAGLWRAEVDRSQLENAIVNLAVNARDAMPDGGRLTIETANAHVAEEYAREADIRAGQYVQIAVTDTGSGMTDEVLAKAFDPFFTTKEVGKGTGLGLSQVFGFVRQSRGHIRIYSEVGVGTTVRVYLPRYYGTAPTPEPGTAIPLATSGSADEIILVVEDDDRVRTFSVEALRDLGYTVIHASDGASALAMLEGGQRVSLLFTDIVMPGMTGRELVDRAQVDRPDLKVLYTTGYTRNAVVHNGVLDPGTNLLSKPFGIGELARKVRGVLDD